MGSTFDGIAMSRHNADYGTLLPIAAKRVMCVMQTLVILTCKLAVSKTVDSSINVSELPLSAKGVEIAEISDISSWVNKIYTNVKVGELGFILFHSARETEGDDADDAGHGSLLNQMPHFMRPARLVVEETQLSPVSPTPPVAVPSKPDGKMGRKRNLELEHEADACTSVSKRRKTKKT